MMILHFPPNFQKYAFLHNWEFWGKILIFENTLITTERRKYKQFIWKHILAYIFFDIIEYV